MHPTIEQLARDIRCERLAQAGRARLLRRARRDEIRPMEDFDHIRRRRILQRDGLPLTDRAGERLRAINRAELEDGGACS
jgi:hypothetical protein